MRISIVALIYPEMNGQFVLVEVILAAEGKVQHQILVIDYYLKSKNQYKGPFDKKK